MRRFRAVLRWVVLAHTRGPVLLVAPMLFVVILAAGPTIGDPGSISGIRSSAAFAFGAGQIVLFGLALVLPLASARRMGPRHLGATLSRRVLPAAVVAGHGLVLLLIALLLAILAVGMIRFRHGKDALKPTEAVRQRLESSSEVFRLGPKNESQNLRFTLPKGSVADHLEVLLSPTVLVQVGEPAPTSGMLSVPLLVEVTTPSGRRESPTAVSLRLGRPEEVSVAVPGGFTGGEVTLSLRRAAKGYALDFKAADVTLIGREVAVSTAVARGFLLLALGVFSLLAICTWVSRFVSFPLVIAVGIVVMGLAASESSLLPGVALMDPGRLMATGLQIGWFDLVPTLLKALLFGAVPVLLPFFDPRQERES